MNQDIEQAIASPRANASRYAKPTRYYNGDHDLAFATEKFQNTFGTLFREFALNLCPVICDAVRDKLRVTGFSVDGAGLVSSPRVGSPRVNKGKFRNESTRDDVEITNTSVALTDVQATDTEARRIWHRNRMGTRADEIHKEALKCGDAYMFVWPNAAGEAVLYPHPAIGVTVREDDDSLGRILWAAKTWATADKHIRLNLYYPDRIEKYVSLTGSEGTLLDANDFAPLPGTHNFGPAIIANPYGVVPVFHFANNADLGRMGRSELEAAIPVQDGLNKSVLDMLVAMEYSAFRQRWVAGIEFDLDSDGKEIPPFKSGVDTLWMSSNKDATFGDFEAAELDQFLKVKDSFRIDMASVTGTPLHYFLPSMGSFPSGESLKKAETRFLSKVRDRQGSFGQVWADVMAFALLVEGARDAQLITEWEDPAPIEEREFLENILLKKQIGLPVEQALIEAGYGEADVKRMVKALSVE